MNNLVLNNDGFFKQIYNNNIVELIPISDTDDIRFYYNDNIDMNITLYNFFLFIEKNLDKINSDFISWHRGFKLDSFIEEVKKEKVEDTNIDFIEFYKVLEINESHDDIYLTSTSEIESYSSYHGISLKEEINYSLGFTPLYNIKNIEMILKKTVSIYKNIHKDDSFKNIEISKSNVSWTLHEVLASFISEMTFYGYPEDRDEFANKINDTKPDDYVTFDINDFTRDRLKELLEKEIKNENYEICKRIKDKIDKIDNPNKLLNSSI